MQNEILVNKLKNLIDSFIDSSATENEVLLTLDSTIDMLLSNADNYINHFEDVVSIFEPSMETQIAVIVKFLLDCYNHDILNKVSTGKRGSVPSVALTEEEFERFSIKAFNQFSYREHVDIESKKITFNGFDIRYLDGFLRYVYFFTQDLAFKNMSDEDINFLCQLLVIARNAAEQSGRLDYYSHIVSIFVNSLSLQHHNQIARNLSTGFLLFSYNNNNLDYGYYVSFSCFARQRNTIRAGLSGILFAKAIAQRNKVDLTLVENFIKYLMMYLRDLGLFFYVEDVYLKLPPSLEFSDYELRSFELIRLMARSSSRSDDTIDFAVVLLKKHIDAIEAAGDGECYPWATQIIQLRRLFSNKLSLEQDMYLIECEKNLLSSTSSALRDQLNRTFYGSISEQKSIFKDELHKVTLAINRENFVYDVDYLNVTANNLLRSSLQFSDIEAYLLALLVKADYSLLFSGLYFGRMSPLITKSCEIDTHLEAINDWKVLLDTTTTENSYSLLCIASCEDEIYRLYKSGDTTEITKLEFTVSIHREWFKKHYPQIVFNIDNPNIQLGETLIDLCHLQDKIIKKNLEFSCVFSSPPNELLLVKDVNLSSSPHNLLLNQYKEYISLYKPVTNIMSLEWYQNACCKELPIPKMPSIGIWIPTDSQDFTINMLFCKLEDTITRNNMKIITGVNNVTPLSCNINIIAAHGNSDTCVTNKVFAGGIYDADSLLNISGEGDVAILLICHSGHTKSSLYGHQTHSLVRCFLDKGYSSVVAPFWSLHIDIAHNWIDSFIDAVVGGKTVSQSLFIATKSVYSSYPTPSAWACLHLYGNPKVQYIV